MNRNFLWDVVAHLCKHVVGKHLPRSFATWLDMPLVARMESFKALLKQIETITKCKDHEALLQMVAERKWYPGSSNVEVTEEDVSLFNQFNHYFTGEIVEKTLTIKPPNCTDALIHWRLISNIINIIGEEDIHFE